MAKPRWGLGALVVAGLMMIVLGLVCVVGGTAYLVRHVREARETEHGTDVRNIDIVSPDDGWRPDEGSDSPPTTSGDPAADDGELHDALDEDVSYRVKRDSWGHDEVEHLKAYDSDVWCVFEVSYPQLEGDIERLNRTNRLLESTALETVRTYYDDPSAKAVERVKKLGENESKREDSRADLLLASDVDYAISYNSEDLLSVCYSDKHYLGSSYIGYIDLRTVNVNLRTGEVYHIDDVMTVTRPMAIAFVENIKQSTGTDANGDGRLSDDECPSLRIIGRSNLVRGLRGRGPLADRITTCFFVDGNGKVNLGASYTASNGGNYVSGWWDVTLTDEQIAEGRKDSTLWELLP